MRATRRFFTAILLTAYVLFAVGAEPLHLWQVSGCGQGCLAVPADGSKGQYIGCCGHHDHHAQDADGQEDHVPREDHSHDSSDCSVCQVLGQAQDKVVPASLVVSGDVVAAVPFSMPLVSPQPLAAGFRSRAPPAA